MLEAHPPGPQSSALGSIPHPAVDRGDTVWPTVILGISIFSVFGISTFGFFASHGWLPAAICVLVNTATIYFGFTLIHEASHRNISRSQVWLNDGMGYLAAFMFHGSYRQFVTIHMRHHANTNVPVRDPDDFVIGGINPKNFFRWCFALYYYFLYYTREGLYKPQRKLGVFGPYATVYLFYGVALYLGFFPQLALIWGLPAFIAVGITIYLFDYQPHHPHNEVGRYTNCETYRGGPIANGISMMQNYHIIHHMWPAIPWYKYEKAYRLIEPDLKARGHKEHHYWKTFLRLPGTH